MSARKLISIVVPVFNEVENVEPLYEAVEKALEPLGDRYDHEYVFTDNHSTDGTFDIIAGLAARDGRVRAYRFSRNVGFQRSIKYGYSMARGDAAVQLDCDLQDPPALITDFVQLWEQGHQVVYGVRRARREGFVITALRKLFYRLISALSEDPLQLDAGDFRLVDRAILDGLRSLDDSRPYLRGAIAAMGFKQTGVEYDRAARARGESKFSLSELWSLALDGILNHSVAPLRFATYTGLAISLVTFLAVIGYIIASMLFGQSWPAGFATTTVLLLLGISLNALFLGIIGEYLGRIYQQVKRTDAVLVEREVARS